MPPAKSVANSATRIGIVAGLAFALKGIPKHPVHSVQQIRLPKYETNTFHGLPQVADGILYIDHMAPATALRPAVE